MKHLPIIALSALTLTGCAYVHSTTRVTVDPQTKQLVSETHVSAYTLLDADSTMAKLSNRAGTNNGTYIGGLNEGSSATNIVAIFNRAGQIIGYVVPGL